MNTTHYSDSMLPAVLATWAVVMARDIVNKFSKKGEFASCIPVLCYSGMSGIAHATALSLELSKKKNFIFNLIYVRKQNESTHGHSVEWSSSYSKRSKYMLIFVDDFISSGTTQDYTLSSALNCCECKPVANVDYYVNALGICSELTFGTKKDRIGKYYK